MKKILIAAIVALTACSTNDNIKTTTQALCVADVCVPLPPEAITGLVGWYRADALQTPGMGVSSWTDLSPTNAPALQATASKQMTSIATDSAFNNLPTVSSPSGKWASTAVNIDLSGSYTIFTVVNYSSLVTYNGLYRYASSSSTFVSGEGAIDGLVESDGTLAYGVEGTWGWFSPTGTIVTNTTYTIMTKWDNAVAVSTVRLNGTDITSTGTFDTTPSAGGANLKLHLGCGAQGVSEGLTGKMAEQIWYNKALNTSQTASIESYLRTRYMHY